jgi:chemotaxis protein MotB
VKKRHKAHANHERWLVSYADFITLLFAFFVVMFSASQVDQRKAGKLAMAIQVAFQEMGVFPSSNSRSPLANSEPMPFDKVQVIEKAIRTGQVGPMVPNADGKLSEGPHGKSLGEIEKELARTLQPEITRGEVSLHAGREGLVLSLREIGFFDSGSAEVRLKSEPAMERIAQVLASDTCSVRIEGHTDNVPIHNSRFASNWELSTARATEVTRLFLTRYHIAPWRVSAAGYAEYHPAADNSTPEGRAVNRRVDIVILAHSTAPPADYGQGAGRGAASPPSKGVQ